MEVRRIQILIKETDLAVVGLGALGSAVLREAARRGISAIGVEQFEPGHERGASGGKTRIFRVAYKEGSRWVPLLTEARGQWEELQSYAHETLWQSTGALTIGHPADPDISRLLESAERHRLPIERLDPSAAAQRWPQHRYLDSDTVVFDPLGGLLRPDVAIRTMVRSAQEQGAEVVLGDRMVDLRDDSTRVELLLGSGDRIRAKRVLLAMGPWAATAVPELNSTIELRRIVLTWFRPVDASLFTPQAFPVGIRRSGEGRNLSFFPQTDDAGIKVNFHVARDVLSSMASASAAIDPAYPEWVAGRVPEAVRGLEVSPSDAAAYVEAFTADHRIVLGPVPGRQRVWGLTGGSGHAFKLAPALARIALEVIDGTDADSALFTKISSPEGNRGMAL
jgi:sarcosine oxidase